MPLTIYYKNALKIAEDGLGDGTVYASATGATPDQANKHFTLTGLSIIADLGADADDKFNGYILYFPASQNKYHIIDWEAAQDRATIFSNDITDMSIDTGACEIRRALYVSNAMASNPLLYAVDGFVKSTKWKSNGLQSLIYVHLPNLLDNGGFESSSLTPWLMSTSGGTADTSAINSTSPILGIYDYKLNRGDRTWVQIAQNITRIMKANTTYRLLFKAKYSGTLNAGDFEIYLFRTLAKAAFSNPSSGSIFPSSSAPRWEPVLTTSNAWHWIDVVMPSFDLTERMNLIFRITGTSTADIFIDEIYFFPKVNIASLILANFTGAFNSVSEIGVGGLLAPRDRTNWATGSEFTNLLTTGVDVISSESGGISLFEFTAGAFPIYRIDTANNTGLNEAGEIMLYEKWAQQRSPQIVFDPLAIEFMEERNTTISGIDYRYLFHEKPHLEGIYPKVPAADLVIWKGDFLEYHIRQGNPFVAKWPGYLDEPILLVNVAMKFGTPYSVPDYPDISFDWKKIVG